MKKDIAIQLMKTISSLDNPLNRVAGLIEEIEDEEERKKFRRGIATVMGRLYTDLEMLVIRQYPDLDPDKKLSE